MPNYMIFTNACGQQEAATLDEARTLAAQMAAPEWDQPRIFQWLPGCAGSDCTCAGQIHPQSREIPS